MIFFDWTAEELRKQADLEDEKEAAARRDGDSEYAHRHKQRALELRRSARLKEFSQ